MEKEKVQQAIKLNGKKQTLIFLKNSLKDDREAIKGIDRGERTVLSNRFLPSFYNEMLRDDLLIELCFNRLDFRIKEIDQQLENL